MKIITNFTKSLLFFCGMYVSSTIFAQSNQIGGSLNQRSGEYTAPAGGLEGAIPTTTVIKQEVVISKPSNVNIENASMADFQLFDKSCKAGDGNACLIAAKIMMAEKPPQEIFNLSSTNRINRAIRLYEASITANGNLEAMELVYDLYYDRNILERQMHSYTDKDRAGELMQIMLGKNYPGGRIRQARDYIEDPEYLLSFSKKKEACVTARALSTQKDLSQSTKAIVDEMLSGNICLISK